MSDVAPRYVYTDNDFDVLSAWTYRHHETGTVASVLTSGHVYIPAADLPDVVRGLYRAAEAPAPVLLEPHTITGDATLVAGFTRVWARGSSVAMDAPPVTVMSPALARRLAAVLAAWADIAEANEPDPARVAVLAAAIRDDWPHGAIPADVAERAARTALRVLSKQEEGAA